MMIMVMMMMLMMMKMMMTMMVMVIMMMMMMMMMIMTKVQHLISLSEPCKHCSTLRYVAQFSLLPCQILL